MTAHAQGGIYILCEARPNSAMPHMAATAVDQFVAVGSPCRPVRWICEDKVYRKEEEDWYNAKYN